MYGAWQWRTWIRSTPSREDSQGVENVVLMRSWRKAIGMFLGVIVVLVGAVAAWFFLYSADLPDMNALAQFAPTSVTRVSDTCLGTASVAIPYDAIGDNLRAALSAGEVGEEDRGGPGDTYREFIGQTPHRATLTLQISRGMFCVPSRALNRQVKEVRTAAQLERRFSRRELFTIFANRAWFGDGQTGVEAASEHFFGKEPNQLQVAEAALLAGLIRAPSRFSPYAHPDRALQRRNEVIDAMVATNTVSAAEGEAAKASLIGVVAR